MKKNRISCLIGYYKMVFGAIRGVDADEKKDRLVRPFTGLPPPDPRLGNCERLRVCVNADEAPPKPNGGDSGSPASHRRIENHIARPGEVPDDVHKPRLA